MNRRFNDLETIAASQRAMTHVVAPATGEEMENLLGAWSCERAGRIECSLLLDRASRMILRMLADGEITPKRRRQARRVVRIIRDTPRDGLDDRGK